MPMARIPQTRLAKATAREGTHVSIDDFIKSLIVQLPNFAGLLVCVFVLIYVILMQQKQIQRQQARIDELCGDKTIEPIDVNPLSLKK